MNLKDDNMIDFLFEKTKHGFFDDLVNYFVSISSLGTSFELHHTGKAQKWLPNHHLSIEGIKSVTNCEIRFYPHSILSTILNNGWPNQIRLLKIPLSNNQPKHPINLTGLQKMHGSMIQSAFVHYFESHRFEIEKKFGENSMNWPL